ncbi:Alkaline ceramidase 3 [Pleurostoma richardsiae]|uniref:Alkaline ceramidase 3 n=1 Tax=Pleurostoma richardsiae TaxID=41990 RepID=A0AA38RUK6_9PEZI|nr:Alkaline ceramidase 3 [Pleurostoma richardsiae]
MPSMLQFPYREARDGIWGEQTSTLNWCEEDYNITPYCAELINTLTNLTFMYLGISGVRNCLRYQHKGVFVVGYIGYLIVGLGSMAFHSTLKYSMQLADELPMIYTTCVLSYATFSYSKSRRYSIFVALALVALAAFITIYYWCSKDPVFHQVAYGGLTAATIFRGMYVMEAELRPALKARSPNRADFVMRQMWKMAAAGISQFLIGFTIWNLDNIYCHNLRRWRGQILLPGSIVLEGHGWWHIFTGLAYYLIVWRVWLERCLGGSEQEFILHWPSLFTSVPRVVPAASVQPKDELEKKKQ